MNPNLKNIIRFRRYKRYFQIVCLCYFGICGAWLAYKLCGSLTLFVDGVFGFFFTLLAISIFLKHLLKNLYFIKLSPSEWAQSSFPLFLSVSGHPDGGCALFKRKKEKCCWDWKHFNFYSMNRSRIMTSSQNACQILYL